MLLLKIFKINSVKEANFYNLDKKIIYFNFQPLLFFISIFVFYKKKRLTDTS